MRHEIMGAKKYEGMVVLAVDQYVNKEKLTVRITGYVGSKFDIFINDLDKAEELALAILVNVKEIRGGT